MEPRISLITLGVTDLARARRFYVDGLGLTEREGSTAEVAFLQMQPGLVLALWSRESLAHDAGVDAAGEGFRAVTFAHNVESRETVDVVLTQAVDAGARLLKPGAEAFWGGYTGYFEDPEGFVWEVAWNPFMPDLATGSASRG